MIKMTPPSKTPYQTLVDAGVALIKSGVPIMWVMDNLTKETSFLWGKETADELREEIEFWAGKPKG